MFANVSGLLGPSRTAPGPTLLSTDPGPAGFAVHAAVVVLPLPPEPWTIFDSAVVQL